MKNKINSKSISRIAAIQILYQFENIGSNNAASDVNNNITNIENIKNTVVTWYKSADLKNDYELDENFTIKLSQSHLDQLVAVTYDNFATIDQIIISLIEGQKAFQALSKLLLSLLRVAIGELTYINATPYKVVIDQYTNIASDMLDEKDVGFVNAIIDQYANNISKTQSTNKSSELSNDL